MKKYLFLIGFAVALLLSPIPSQAAGSDYGGGEYDPTDNANYDPTMLYYHWDELRHDPRINPPVTNTYICFTEYVPMLVDDRMCFFATTQYPYNYRLYRYNGTGFTKLSYSSEFVHREHTWNDGYDSGVSESRYRGSSLSFNFGEWFSSPWNVTADNFQTNVPVFGTEQHALAYFKYGDSSGMLNRPTSSNITTTDDTFFLTNFNADATIAATWAGVSDSAYVDDNAFVDVFFGYGLSDKPGLKATMFEWGTRYKPDDNGFVIPRHDIVLPDSKVPVFLRCMFVTPVYMRDGKYVKGLASKVWFTRDGLIESIETSPWGGTGDDPGPPVPPEEEDTGKGILDTIRRFFNTFFTNIVTSIKGLFVPEEGYFTDFFTRMNDFFSEKLGMLYAPIDIFVTLLTEIMNAGGGNAGIQFPGVQWDGTYIIQPQLVSLDTIAGDFPGLQDALYFVTDVIMVGAVLLLAQQKLQEVVHT